MNEILSYQNIVIVWIGGIGTRIVQQISENYWWTQWVGSHMRIIGLVNSEYIVIEKKQEAIHGISHGNVTKEELRNKLAHTWNRRNSKWNYDDIIPELQDHWWDMKDLVIIDTTPDKSDYMLQFHKSVLKSWGKIATANKNPISLFKMEDFIELTNKRWAYKYSASVMAGAPCINVLQDAIDTNNNVLGIEWCFSWTLGFITSGIETRKLSEVLQDAIDKGYTEPNPWDDLNGLDVARKILILARTAGFSIDMNDVFIEPFLPKEFEKYSKEEIVNVVRNQLDQKWEERIKNLALHEKTLRYVAKLDIFTQGKTLVKVELQEVNKNSPLWSLSGTKNKIIIKTENIGEQIFEQAGAGINVTAQWLINELRRIL